LARRAIRAAEEPVQPLALVAAHRTLGECARALGDAETAEREFAAALDLADACAAPFERARTLFERATLRIAGKTSDQAEPLFHEARSAFIQLEAQLWLDRLDAVSAVIDRQEPPTALPGGLTPREAEVLKLVAQGLTDAQVAERLYISPRTVSQHLRSIYHKLEVPSRAAATRYAMEHGLA
jgi:DNA-binding CsgD family transcriptional regulator